MLLQIVEEAKFDAGVERTLPAPYQFCVVVGKSVIVRFWAVVFGG